MCLILHLLLDYDNIQVHLVFASCLSNHDSFTHLTKSIKYE